MKGISLHFSRPQRLRERHVAERRNSREEVGAREVGDKNEEPAKKEEVGEAY